MHSASDDFWSGKRALVTGGGGFLGTHLCRGIKRAGGEVFATSRSRSGEQDGLNWIRADFADVQAARDVLSAVKPGVVYHLAGSVGAAPEIDLVLPTYHSLLTSTVNVLMAATEAGCERVILPGSFTEPLANEAAPVPQSPYAAAKWASSAYGRMFHARFGTPVVILRTFMTYGPAQHPSKLIPSVTRSLLVGERPRLSSGRNKADWVFIADVIEAFMLGASVPGIDGMTMDIGSGKLVTMRALIEQLVDVVGVDVEPHFGALEDRPGENQIAADTTHAEMHLGWKPTTSLKNGLQQTAEWHRVQLAKS